MRSTQNLILNEEKRTFMSVLSCSRSQDLIRKTETMLGVSDSGDLIQGINYTVIGRLKEQKRLLR